MNTTWQTAVSGLCGVAIGVVITLGFINPRSQNEDAHDSWRTVVEDRLFTQEARLSSECKPQSLDCVAAFYIKEAESNARAMGAIIDPHATPHQ